ncbi:MAG: acetate--CoA ligase [Myxococcales bacterium]|nr:acetate--CoA ligase [Myxococcales bacterium]
MRAPFDFDLSHYPEVRSFEDYRALYRKSLEEPEAFWREMAQCVTWFHEPHSILDADRDEDDVSWFSGGRTNVCFNCVDRHAARRPEHTALIWAANEPGVYKRFTFRQLKHEVGRVANVLRAHGVQKGDRVCLYMPMVPEAVFAMLACARIGAVHSVVFAGFSADALRDRVLDAGAKVVVTANEAPRGAKSVALKALVDAALQGISQVKSVLVVRRTDGPCAMTAGRDHFLDDECAKQRSTCPFEWMSSEDPLFILYTSGSTGKPKGLLHTTAGYLVYAATTHRYVFDARADDVQFTTADVGWITGHTYLVYGPLANGVTTVVFESLPTWPDAGRLWRVADDVGATVLYTAPTALRSLMRAGDSYVTASSRKTIRILGTVGEPINPEVWRWYHEVVGESKRPIVDTWWQTETGGALITPLPGTIATKPGSATLPFFGVEPLVCDESGAVIDGNDVSGHLYLARSWPGQARSIYGDHRRFRETYFSRKRGVYFTGDGCRRDEDGYYWITGRVDDVLNVSGHRLGTAEIESALVSHEAVSEAAVVGVTHAIKGEAVFAWVAVRPEALVDRSADELVGALKETVRQAIGPIAVPDTIRVVSALPKTRSGKIMRRILRNIAQGNTKDLGDTSTLADPSVIDELLAAH